MEEANLRRTWAEIDMDALAHNYRQARRRIGPNVKYLGVVKADAYGHGARAVAAQLWELGIRHFATATLDEAVQLREAGIRTQIHGEQKKFKQKISYADKLSIPYAVFLGEDEISSGVCAVKDLATGEQVKLSPADAIAHIQAGLKKRNQGTPILDRGE